MTFENSTLKELSFGDLHTYLKSTFSKILIPKADEFQYYFVRDIEESKEKNVILSSDSEDDVLSFPLKSLVFDFKFSETGFYSLDGEAIYYSQRPKRQSQKALNHHSHSIQHLLKANVHQYFEAGIYRYSEICKINEWTCSSLNKIFLKEDSRSVETRISNILKNKNLACPLDRNFAISIGITSRFPSIWFRNCVIGTLVSPKRITLSNPLFMQEAIDLFSQHDIQISQIS